MRYNSYKYRPKNKSPTDEHEKKRNRNLRFKRLEGLRKKIEKYKKPKKAVYLRFERISRKRRVGVLCMWKKSSNFAGIFYATKITIY